MAPLTPKWLAYWRRNGGVWIITFVVEGYDETFDIYAPGIWARWFARLHARMELAKALGESMWYVHEQSIRREG